MDSHYESYKTRHFNLVTSDIYNASIHYVPAYKVRKHEEALKMALHLADDTNSEVTALTVIEPVPSYIGLTDAGPEYEKMAGEKAMAALRKFVGPLSEVKTVILHGSAGTQIVEYAKDKDIDCIVIASHKPGLSDYFLGSTAARVVRHAPCCVHVMR